MDRAKGSGVDASASVLAGLLLLARKVQSCLSLPHSSVAAIMRATGACQSQAYSRRSELLHIIASLDRPPGRPRAASEPTVAAAITRQVLRFLMENPGAVYSTGPHRSYSNAFRLYVLSLRAEYSNLDIGIFAEAVQVPLSSLRTWLHGRNSDSPAPVAPRAASMLGEMTPITRAWLSWRGSLSRFCDHVQREMGLPWKRSRITALLSESGLRVPRSRRSQLRGGRTPRGAFKTFFPGAQWVADGKCLTLCINEEVFSFNLQLVVDAHSGALLGASLRDHEDSQAVTDAFADAVAAAGMPPLALLLDNRSCNHSAEVGRLKADTLLTYAARGRPQSKGHVEGAFGLFSQAMPELVIRAKSPRELARQILHLLFQVWARTLNFRPRRERDGRSRVELYQDASVTPAMREAARAALCKRALRSSHPRRWKEAPHQGGLRAFVESELVRLELPDPGGFIAQTLCGHPLDAILVGIATYEGKRVAGTLPSEADGAYLLGIVRNLAEYDEGMHIADAFWRVRSSAQSHLREIIEARARGVAAQTGTEGFDTAIDEAMATLIPGERRLWLMAVGRALRNLDVDQRSRLYRRVARRIHALWGVPYVQRLEAVRLLAIEALPIH